jgi:hypothetical protein
MPRQPRRPARRRHSGTLDLVRDILRSKHFVVTVDEERRILWRARTAAPFESIEEVHAAYAVLLEALRPLHRPLYGQLVDARDAPPRNDPAFESVVTSHHKELYASFRASSVLVKTAAGRLQVRRMLDASKIGAPVFLDETAALAYLTSASGG